MMTGCANQPNETPTNETGSNESTYNETISSLENTIDTLESNLNEKTSELDKITTTLENKKVEITQLETQLNDINTITSSGPTLNNSLINEAITVMGLIASQDAVGLNLHVSPTNGVRFTPYPYIDINNDIVFYANQTVSSLFTSSTIYTWGYQDGSGNPITEDFSTYYSDYVYNHDFINCDIIGVNTTIGTGNTINNLTTVYPNDSFVEFHFTGFDPQFSGMDWASLTLVFEQDNGYWYLVGVVHGQWTI